MISFKGLTATAALLVFPAFVLVFRLFNSLIHVGYNKSYTSAIKGSHRGQTRSAV
jgi:hypothetical protein